MTRTMQMVDMMKRSVTVCNSFLEIPICDCSNKVRLMRPTMFFVFGLLRSFVPILIE